MKKSSDWLKSLDRSAKLVLGVLAALIVVGLAGNHTPTKSLNDTHTAQKSQQSQQPKAPTITTKTETETQSIPFTSTTVQTASLAKGVTKVTTAGVNGSQTLTYTVTYTDGQQTDKQLTDTTVTLPPVTQVTSVGTYVAPPPPPPAPKAAASNCDPNYSGACVPNVYPSDVDCAGGSGNGPYYVQGPVHVIGVDHYGLDGNGDGVGCEQ